jgi:DNA polymerase I-like protein with 3'-5' exonuclease and polymerase domains
MPRVGVIYDGTRRGFLDKVQALLRITGASQWDLDYVTEIQGDLDDTVVARGWDGLICFGLSIPSLRDPSRNTPTIGASKRIASGAFKIAPQSFNYRCFPFRHPTKVVAVVLDSAMYCSDTNVHVLRAKRAIEKMDAAFENFDREFPPFAPFEQIGVIPGEEEICNWLRMACDNKGPVAIDYETTGLKPQRDGHRIISVAVAMKLNGIWQSKAFPFLYNSQAFLSIWKTLVEKDGKIIAHNAPFEASWTHCRGGLAKGDVVMGLPAWDTCLAEHCIDNNSFTGLKLLTYLYFGIVYNAPPQANSWGVENEDEFGNNSFNSFVEFNDGQVPEPVLTYNALDSLFTGYLYDAQQLALEPKYRRGLFLLLQAQWELGFAHERGIRLDMERFKKEVASSKSNIQKAVFELYSLPIVKKWRRGTWDMSKQTHIFEIINMETGKQLQNIDEEELLASGSAVGKQIVKIRHLEKTANTYLAQFARENDRDGVVHPSYHLNKVVTFRTSCSDPNFQNVPKRNKEMMLKLRSMFMPTPGNMFVEWDYKAVEVTIAASYHRDPNMVNYLVTPGTDMHKDTAAILFKRESKDVTKAERQLAKNQFVFPIFYGASSKSMAPGLWKGMSDETRTHMKQVGIGDFDKFAAHIKQTEDHFWKTRFPQYGKWRNELYDEFQKTGQVELYTGFRCLGPSGFTEVVNRPVQGSACHCLLMNLIESGRRIRELSGRSAIIGQIHDSLIGDIHPDELEACNAIIKECGITLIKKRWKWVVTPLEIEWAATPVDGHWNELEEKGMIK